jgi:hypothetical protein
MARYAVAHLDEIGEFTDARCRYRPIRHHLGITAFGATAWTAHAAGDLVIDEHDEGDPTSDEELFLVLRGHAVFEVDGDRVDAPTGTVVFAPPGMKRTASAEEAGTMIIALEGTPEKGTTPAAGSSGRRWFLSTRRVSTPRSPTVYATWSTLLRSTRCCSTTSPAARVSPAGHLKRSITSGTRSRCRRSFAIPQSPTRTWTRSVKNQHSGS